MSAPRPARRQRAPRGAGDRLRDEILDATTELLLDTGVRAVSIRSVAQRVGVTPPSIYLHFADKDALLDAVCARYLEKLDEHIQQAAVGHYSSLEVLCAQGLAYVRFARQTPELYRIATMSEYRPNSDVDAALNSSAFVHIRESVQTLMAEGSYPPGDATSAALELWAAAHGVAALLVSKPYLPVGDPDAFTDRVLRAMCTGQAAVRRAGCMVAPARALDWVAGSDGADGASVHPCADSAR